jgi:hypothetical protein
METNKKYNDDDVFNFEDFLINKITESNSINNQDDEDVEEDVEEITHPEEEEEEKQEKEKEEEVTSKVEEKTNFYPLYRDKAETFSCDIYVEGAKTDDTITRLIIESEDWTLMFKGEIQNGKVQIPIRKLNLFEENQIGKIRLEVIAEGTVFIPWEDQFKIKMSKKVEVSLNETKKPLTNKKEVGVKVKVKK